MKMKTPSVNKDLLPFKIHYFLKNGGISFLPFLAPMAIQRGISPEGVGLIWTLNPLVSSVTNITCGALADAWKIHRTLLLAALTLLTASFTAFFFLPAIPMTSTPTKDISVFVQCSKNLSSLIMCPTDVKPNFSSGESVPLCNINDTHFETAANEKCEFKCNLKYYTRKDISYLPENISLNEHFTLSRQNMCPNGKCFTINHDNITHLLLSNSKRDCGIEFHLACENLCGDHDGVEEIPLTYLLKTGAFWLNALGVILIYVGLDASSSLADTMCIVVLGENRHRYGQTRLFGSLGWGLMGFLMGGLVNLCSKDHPETNYTPAMVLTACFLSFNLLFTTRINTEVPGKDPGKESGTGVREVLLSFHCIFLLTTTLITGMTMGLLLTFEFIYLRNVSLKWDPSFSYLNLLQGLTVGIDCFAGEVPFYFLSAFIIKKLSNVHTFSLTLTATSIRLLLYTFITNPWLFLPVHLLHGLSFGVFLPNMIAYVNLLAPRGAQATLQSIAMACYTVGRSLGALGGGLLMESLHGSKTFLTMGLIVTAYTIIYIVVNCVVERCNKNIRQDDERGEYQNPNEKEKREDTECVDDQTCVQENEVTFVDNNSHQIE